jgi:hypothetical protein
LVGFSRHYQSSQGRLAIKIGSFYVESLSF